MLFLEKDYSAGEHSLLWTGRAGQVETILTIPTIPKTSYVALLGHPNSLQGGTMNNKVVTTMARTFQSLGIPAIRFNFRGVGQTEGQYEDGLGESEDMLDLANLWRRHYSNAQIIFAGFSFGGYVAYRAAAQSPTSEVALLLTVAPGIHRHNFEEFSLSTIPWYLFQGDNDEIAAASLAKEFAATHQPPLPITLFPNTTHFFHGQLLTLKAKLIALIQQTLVL